MAVPTRTSLGLGVLLLGLGAPLTASAITIDGIELPDEGAVFKTASIWQGRTDGPNRFRDPINDVGQTLGGVGFVESIKDTSGATVWQDGDNGRELTFQYGGYVTERLEDDSDNLAGGGSFDPTNTPIEVWFRGGGVTFWSDSSPDRNASPTTVDTFSDGTRWLQTEAAPNLNCETGDECASGDGTGVTLQGFVNSGQLSEISAGNSSGFLNVAGSGSANSIFNSDSLGPDANDNPVDMTLGADFNSVTAAGFDTSGSADLKSNIAEEGPRPRPQPVPTPGSLSLLGIGLLALGLLGFRFRRGAGLGGAVGTI